MKSMKTLAMIMAMTSIAMEPERKKKGLLPGKLPPANRKTSNKHNGMKQFFINGIEVWAINEKNAVRKVKNYLDNQQKQKDEPEQTSIPGWR